MLMLALQLELRTLIRSRAGAAALLAYLATGGLAIALGERHVAEWQQAVETAEEAEATSIAEARAFFEREALGPAESPWVNLSQPMWQDRYASTRIARAPGPLAGVAVGSIDPAPVVFRVHRRADPLSTGGYRIENPELTAGAVDLVFVLSMLTPLLVGVLGLGIGGREREERIDRLVTVQAGEVRSWLLARMLAVTAIASVAAGALCLAAGLTGGASPAELVALIGLALTYTVLWGGLLLAVNASAQSVRAGAFAFGALWTVVCVLLPTVFAEVGLGRVQADFAVADTLEARALTYGAYEQELDEATTALYAHYPELQQLPAAAEEALPPLVGRHVYDGLLFAGLSDRHTARLTQEAAARQLAERAAWVSPPVALTLALERLAGVGPEAASAYRGYLMDAVEARVHWIVVQAWGNAPLSPDAFDELVASSPPPFRWKPTGLAGPGLLLLAWLLAGWLIALAGLTRAERRMGSASE